MNKRDNMLNEVLSDEYLSAIELIISSRLDEGSKAMLKRVIAQARLYTHLKESEGIHHKRTLDMMEKSAKLSHSVARIQLELTILDTSLKNMSSPPNKGITDD